MLRIKNIKIKQDISDSEILKIALKQNHINKDDLISWQIAKKSIDARKKEDVHYSYSINLELKNEHKYKKLEKVTKIEMPSIIIKNNNLAQTVIIGLGPAGLFSALTLIENGIKPIIIEQGRFC